MAKVTPVKTDYVKKVEHADAFDEMNQHIAHATTQRKKKLAKLLKRNKTSRQKKRYGSQPGSPRSQVSSASASLSPRPIQINYMKGKHAPPNIEEEAELTLRAKELEAARMFRRSKAIREVDMNKRRKQLEQKKAQDKEKHDMIANEIRRKHNPHFLDTVQEFVFGPGKSVLQRKGKRSGGNRSHHDRRTRTQRSTYRSTR